MAKRECDLCGACCIAPDIAALGKAIGQPCPHLRADRTCSVYATRPKVCRDYSADEICDHIAAPTLDERVRRYRELFDI